MPKRYDLNKLIKIAKQHDLSSLLTSAAEVGILGGYREYRMYRSQRVGKNNAARKTANATSVETHTLAASVFTHMLRGTFCTPCTIKNCAVRPGAPRFSVAIYKSIIEPRLETKVARNMI
jgi:hypothetical protein